jgi:hypothetical protein
LLGASSHGLARYRAVSRGIVISDATLRSALRS